MGGGVARLVRKRERAILQGELKARNRRRSLQTSHIVHNCRSHLRLGRFEMLGFALALLAFADGQTQASVSGFRLENVKNDAQSPSKTAEANQPPRTTNWASRLGYPTQALREQREGTVHFTAHISSTGEVTSCEVTGSSGSQDLDEATCRELKLRAHFTPATDENGNPVDGVYSQAFRWTIPRD